MQQLTQPGWKLAAVLAKEVQQLSSLVAAQGQPHPEQEVFACAKLEIHPSALQQPELHKCRSCWACTSTCQHAGCQQQDHILTWPQRCAAFDAETYAPGQHEAQRWKLEGRHMLGELVQKRIQANLAAQAEFPCPAV